MGLLSRLEEEIYDYKQRLVTVEAVSRNRLETILLIHGCYFDACSEAESILFDLSKAEDERDQAIKEIGRIGRELGTTQAERDRIKEAIKEFSDKWKYYDSKTITGLDDLRAALREVDGVEVETQLVKWISVPCTSPTCRGLKTGKPFPAVCKVGFENRAVCNECFCK
jgi:hypothetical protein